MSSAGCGLGHNYLANEKTIYALVLCRLMKKYETLQGNTVHMLHQGHSAMEYSFFEQNAHLVNETSVNLLPCKLVQASLLRWQK